MLTDSVAAEKVRVLHFGSQDAPWIVRRMREQHVCSQIVRSDISADGVGQRGARGLVVSGDPASVYQPGSPRCSPEPCELGIPVLGICYRMSLASDVLNGHGERVPPREYGRAVCQITAADFLLEAFRGRPRWG